MDPAATRRSRKWALILGALGLAATAVAAPSCGPSRCSPDDQGLGDAKRLTVRALPSATASAGTCSDAPIQVIASDDELQAFYAKVGFLIHPDGGAVHLKSGDYPVVDFTRERVLVTASSRPESVIWAVVRNDSAIAGIGTCSASTASAGCSFSFSAVNAVVSHSEARRCDDLACGVPVRP